MKVATTTATKRIRVPFVAFCNSLFLPTHRDYNWKIRNDGPKTKKKKADAQMTEISDSADGDFGETKMTETPS